jgi:hypothetical protein
MPWAIRKDENGFTRAKTKIVGANSLNTEVALCHFGPRSTKMISSANNAHAIVIGRVNETRRE